MWIDCSACPNYERECDGCVVAVLTQERVAPDHEAEYPHAPRSLRDHEQRRAIAALVSGGLVSPEEVVRVEAS